MGSSTKTTNLRLNNWTETDCPKRSDFVSDNLIIDNLVGSHIKDGSLHLSADEKDRVSEPFETCTIYGTGESTGEAKFNFTPKLVIMCMKNAPFNKHGSSYTTVNAGVATAVGTTGGVRISEYTVSFDQSTSAQNGVFYNLNNEDEEYILIAFK